MLKLNTIFEGNVFRILPQWPDSSIDLVVTSPPYWQQRDYKSQDLIFGGRPRCKHDWIAVKTWKKRGQAPDDPKKSDNSWSRPSRVSDYYKRKTTNFCSKCGAWRGELGLEPTVQMYIEHMRTVFQEVHRVLTDYGSLYVVIGDTYYGSGSGHKQGGTGKLGCYDLESVSIANEVRGTLGKEFPKKSLCLVPERFIIMMLDEIGFVVRSKIVWWKRNAVPHSSMDKYTPDWEPVYFMTKKPTYWHELQLEPCQDSSKNQNGWGAVGGKKYADLPEYSGKPAVQRDMRTMRWVWDVPVVPSKSDHVAPFPVKLIEPMIQASCPKQVCLNCGKPRKPVYDKNRNVRGYSKCRCDAGFRKGIVADIFAGSGTTLAVAKALNRNWVGIELMNQYVLDAYARLGLDQMSLEEWVEQEEEVDYIVQPVLDDVVEQDDDK